MKKIAKTYLISLLLLLGPLFCGFAQSFVKKSDVIGSPPSTQLLEQINICQWKGGAQTGVSLSFDDNCPTHNEISLMMDEYGFKGSFFVITSRMLVDSLKDIVARGHEVGNHTLSHPDLRLLDSLTLDNEILKGKEDIENALGIKCLTFASTFHSNTPLIRDIGFAHHLYIRNLPEYPGVKRNRVDMGGTVSTFKAIDSLLHASIETGNMLLLTGHGINGDGYDPMVGDSLRQMLDSLKDYSNKGMVWVSTLQQVAQYENLVHEIQLESTMSGDTFVITLDGYLADKYKDMNGSPLSIEFLKSEDDSIEYFGTDLLITQKGPSDIVTIDLQKSTVIKAHIFDPLSSKPITAGNHQLSIFPNPASDYITINSMLPIEKTEVYNLTGKLMLVKRGPIKGLDTSGLKSGVYVIKVSTRENSYTEKISIHKSY